MKKLKWFAIFLLGLVSFGQTSSNSKDAHRNQVQAIRAQVKSANSERQLLTQLIERRPSTLPKSQIGRMLNAAMDAKRNIPGWQDEMIATLPSSDLEMEAFLEFTLESGNEQFRPLLRVYYALAFKAAAAHPESIPKVFQIAREFNTADWPDYDNIDWFCDELKKVKAGNPAAFSTALKTEKADMRNYISGCAR